MAPIFENTDLLAHTCGLLDAADIARLCQSCRFVPEHIRDVKTIKFLSTMRSDAVLGNLSTIERLALVESLRECSTCIDFKVFSCDLLESCLPALKRFAALMKRHRSFSVSIEAHCGLEAPRDAGYIFARERGRNVRLRRRRGWRCQRDRRCRDRRRRTLTSRASPPGGRAAPSLL